MSDETPIPDDSTHALAAAMLGEVMGEIDRADQKASLLIGSLGIAFSIVLSGILGTRWRWLEMCSISYAIVPQ